MLSHAPSPPRKPHVQITKREAFPTGNGREGLQHVRCEVRQSTTSPPHPIRIGQAIASTTSANSFCTSATAGNSIGDWSNSSRSRFAAATTSTAV